MKKPSKKELLRTRINERNEEIYRILRRFQDGEFKSNSGVSAGKLGVEMTVVYDKILEAANKI